MYKVARNAWPYVELPVASHQLLPVVEALTANNVSRGLCTSLHETAARNERITAPSADKFQWRSSPKVHNCSRRWLSSLPPHTKLGMPALSPTMTHGNVVKWYVKEGDQVQPGAALADIETDKATLVFENQEEGVIARILVPEDSRDIPVGTTLAILVEEAADAPSFTNFSEGVEAAAAPAASPPPAAPAAPASRTTYPAHTVMNMPALSPTMTQGNIISWHVKEGATIQPGDVLAEIETDKATLGFENQEEGVIAKILLPAGSKDVQIGTPLAVVVDDESLVEAFSDFSLDSSGGASSPGPTSSARASNAMVPAASSVPRTCASSKIGPAARKLLAEAGLTMDDVEPTGPHGIITKGDILAAVAAGVKPGTREAPAAPTTRSSAPSTPAAAPPKLVNAPSASFTPSPPPSGASYQDIPTTQIRRVIARRLLESKQSIPAMYVMHEVHLDAVTKLRKSLQAQGTKLSVNDFVVRAVALTLHDVGGANVFWNTGKELVEPLANVDVAVAVATPAGLITPVLRDADKKSISQISKEVKDLAARARENRLKPEEYTGGSFTISNLGMYGIKQFSAIINPPQAAILAVGGGRSQTYVTDGGKLAVRSVMNVTLSADNRAYDEQVASKVLETFGNYLANPLKLIL